MTHFLLVLVSCRCAPNFYSAKGSKRPCLRCPFGRVTLDNPKLQRYVTDCLVKPGSGIVLSTDGVSGQGSGTLSCTDAFNPDVSAYNSSQLAAVPVTECPIGYWGSGLSLDGKCSACPAGSSTQEPGSTNVTQCDGEGLVALCLL